MILHEHFFQFSTFFRYSFFSIMFISPWAWHNTFNLGGCFEIILAEPELCCMGNFYGFSRRDRSVMWCDSTDTSRIDVVWPLSVLGELKGDVLWSFSSSIAEKSPQSRSWALFFSSHLLPSPGLDIHSTKLPKTALWNPLTGCPRTLEPPDREPKQSRGISSKLCIPRNVKPLFYSVLLSPLPFLCFPIYSARAKEIPPPNIFSQHCSHSSAVSSSLCFFFLHFFFHLPAYFISYTAYCWILKQIIINTNTTTITIIIISTKPTTTTTTLEMAMMMWWRMPLWQCSP